MSRIFGALLIERYTLCGARHNRHSHIMHYVVDRSVPLPIVQKQVGHRSLKTTSVYLSPSTEKMARAYRAARQQADGETGAVSQGHPHIRGGEGAKSA